MGPAHPPRMYLTIFFCFSFYNTYGDEKIAGGETSL